MVTQKFSPQNERIREVIETIKKQQGLSNARVAALLGVDPSAISQLLSGRSKKPSHRTLDKLETVFRVNPDFIRTGAEPKFVGDIASRAVESDHADAIRRRVVAMRDHLGLTQTELSERTGIPRTSFVLFERPEGRTPTTEHLIALWDHFGVNPAWVLVGYGAMIVRASDKSAAPSATSFQQELVLLQKGYVDVLERNAELGGKLERLEQVTQKLRELEGINKDDQALLVALRSLPAEIQDTWRQMLLTQAASSHAQEEGRRSSGR